jgi:hypothetical protein
MFYSLGIFEIKVKQQEGIDSILYLYHLENVYIIRIFERR